MKTYQVNLATRMRDSLFKTLLHVGVRLGTMSLLTVRGRKSGQLYTVPVLLVEKDDQRWLVSPYGVVQWVRNLRSAGTAILTRGHRSEIITVNELSAREAAPVLQQYLLNGAWVEAYFDATKSSPLAAFESEAVKHPVFRIATNERLY